MAYTNKTSSGTSSAGPVGGATQVGTSFKNLVSGKPNAPIQKPVVGMPSRADYGVPVAAPTVGKPTRSDYGPPSTAGIADAAKTAHDAAWMVKNPTGSEYFRHLMEGVSQTQAANESASNFAAKEAAQKGGFGNTDSARMAAQDRMSNLAVAETAAGKGAAELGADMYGKAESAFVALQNQFSAAKQAGDTAYAQDLTQTHLANANNFLQAAGLSMQQQTSFARDLNEAKLMQAKLDQDFNNSLIDNNRYIEQSQQIAAQLAMQQAALAQHAKEFDITSAEQKREFDLRLKADPNTALRTFSDPRYGGPVGRKKMPYPGESFSGLD